MNWREFIILLGCSVTACPITARAQEPGKAQAEHPFPAGWPATRIVHRWLPARTAELGLIEGRHFVIEYGLAQSAATPAAATELVGRRVDILVAAGTPSVLPAKDAAGQIPVVFVGTLDPVGMASSQASPSRGSNITGLTSISGDIIAKRLQMIRELLSYLLPELQF